MMRLQSNFLSSMVPDVTKAVAVYRRAGIESHRAYIRAGRKLVEARPEAKRGQWSPFLQACGLSDRTARNMMALARGWSAKGITAIGGVRVALDFNALVKRLTADLGDLPAEEVVTRKGPGAIAARKGPESFIAYCEGVAGDEPAEVIRRLADDLKPLRETPEKPESVSGNGADHAARVRLRREGAREAVVVRHRIGRALEGRIREAAARGEGARILLSAADVRRLVDGEGGIGK